MQDNRDNFPADIIEKLKKRAAFICSNPKCKKMTVAPSEVAGDKVLYIGKAAHICAAAENGPRYDSKMTPEERSSITNGIFLCSNCADMVDDNKGIDFSVDLLHKWKKDHEKWVLGNLNKSIGEDKEKTVFNVVSYNQSGGITAGQVIIGSQPRLLTEDLKQQLKSGINSRFTKYGLDQNSLINIFTPPDSEAVDFGNQIKNYLKSEGYNVWNNLSSYMGDPGLGNLDIGFKYEKANKQLQLYINFKKQK